MRSITVATILAALIAVALGGWFAWRNAGDDGIDRNRLTKDFVSVLPDSLGEEKTDEIDGLVRLFWKSCEFGRVFPEDEVEIESRLRNAVDRKYIGGRDLVVLMARVGYYTYRGQAGLPDGEVDHPELNPDAAIYPVQPDSAVMAEFFEWKARMIREGKIDSTGFYDMDVLREEIKEYHDAKRRP